MSSTVNYVAKSFFWGASAKVINAIIKIFSLPLLLNYLGKADFALISLAISVNTYLQLLDLGVNTGGTKFFAQWIGNKEYDRVSNVAQSSIFFYGIIGIINAIILLSIAYWGTDLFAISFQQQIVMKQLLVVLAFTAIVNWAASVFSQLLIANESIAFIQQIMIVRSFLNLALIGLTIFFNWALIHYFIWFSIINTLQIFPYYIKSRKDGLIQSIIPRWSWAQFSPILKYSIAILAIGIFSITATKFRPVILAAYSTRGIEIIADYRIMETITIFVISIGGMLISIFLPKTAKLVQAGDHLRIQHFAINGTLLTSIICCILCFPLMINAKEILSIYVGTEYVSLSGWLNIWLFTILCYLHNSPVSSIVLATGKTRMLVYSSAISCTISLFLNAILCNTFGVGSAIIGYAVYIGIQISFYYFYFNRKVLHLNSYKIFLSFAIPTLIGIGIMLLIDQLNFSQFNIYLKVFVKSSLWLLIFVVAIFSLRILDLKSITKYFKFGTKQ